MAKYNFPVGEVAEQIANSISWIAKTPVDKSQVVVEPNGDTVGQYVVTIYETPQLAKQIIPFMDEDGNVPIQLGTLCPVGYKTNRKPYMMNPWQHGQLIGATESGKSSCLHVLLAHVLRSPDTFAGIGGVWKLWDFVSSWVEPFLNSDVPCPIWRIAHGQEDVCRLIAAFLNIASYRLNLRNSQRIGLPYGILILDEVTYIAGNRLHCIEFGGENLNASQLIRAMATGTAGAKEYLWMTAQRDTQDNFGDDGGTTTAQMGFSFVFYIRDSGSVGRITNDYGLDTPRSKGECWADFGMNGGIHKLKIPYPQSDDPLKQILHNGPKVSQIALNRAHIRHELDPGSEEAASEYFPKYYPLVTDEFIDYLRSNQKPTSRADSGILSMSSSGSLSEEIMAAEADYHRLIVSGQPDSTPTGVVDLAQYKALGERIVAICKLSNRPLGRKEIIDALEMQGYAVRNPNSITNELGSLVRSDSPEIGRTDDGKYYIL